MFLQHTPPLAFGQNDRSRKLQSGGGRGEKVATAVSPGGTRTWLMGNSAVDPTRRTECAPGEALPIHGVRPRGISSIMTSAGDPSNSTRMKPEAEESTPLDADGEG